MLASLTTQAIVLKTEGYIMTIPLSAPKRKSQYFDVGFHGILAVLAALSPTGPNVPNVLSNLKSGFGALVGAPEDEPSNRAWVWAFKSLSYAASDVLQAERIKAPLSAKKEDAVKEFLDAATQFDGHELDEIALTNPGISPLFANANGALGPMILKATTGTELGLETLAERFKQALRSGSNRALCEDPDYFRVLEEGLTGLAGEGARRDRYWSRHSHWISHYYTDAPIFSPDEDEIIPLKAVYLPLRCFWHQIHKLKDGNGEEVERKTAHVADLHQTAHNWLSRDARQDPLLVVTGGPGSGKSSFARAFAHEVIQNDTHRVLYVQLQHMTLTASLHDDIAHYVVRRDTSTGKNGSPGLPANPLDWRRTDTKPVLMIFDGLDELSTKEEDGERYARELLLALKLLLSPLNTDGTSVRAMVLGRNLACQAAMRAANIPLNVMLNVAPIATMNSETCMMPYKSNDLINDPDALMSVDQRLEYWRRWASIKKLDPSEIPEAVTALSMSELNVEPLLLHLLMISKYIGDEWEVAADNRNVVYEDILRKIFERNKAKEHFQVAGVDESIFFELMECLGIAAWRGNGRTGDEEDFRQVRKLHLNREKMFKEFHAARLKSVALNIHTRSGQEDGSSGFEFIHKSFGEYLAARGLLSHALKTAAALRERESEDLEQPWCQIIGSANLTPEIIDFLYNEARLKLTPAKAIEAKAALTDLINWVLVNGFSVHKVASEVPWSGLTLQQRCASSALLASTSAIATAIPIGDWIAANFDSDWTVNIDWPAVDHTGIKGFFNDLGVTIETSIIGALRRINIADQKLWDTSLSRANLDGADLRFTTLIWSVLIESSLENAILEGVEAAWTILWEVNLRRCNLSDSNFRKARFQSVDMSYCNLRGADFSGVDASSQDLYSDGNPYSRRAVKGALDLEGADLTGANFSDADLSGVINLSIEALNSAFGTVGTKLPGYIDRKKVNWSRKRRGGRSTVDAFHRRRAREAERERVRRGDDPL